MSFRVKRETSMGKHIMMLMQVEDAPARGRCEASYVSEASHFVRGDTMVLPFRVKRESSVAKQIMIFMLAGSAPTRRK